MVSVLLLLANNPDLQFAKNIVELALSNVLRGVKMYVTLYLLKGES